MTDIIRRFVPRQETSPDFSFSDDVDRIVRVCAERDIEITPGDARDAWEKHSDELCAQWLILPESDDALFEIVKGQCEEIETLRD